MSFLFIIVFFFYYSCVQCCCNLLRVKCRSLNAKLSNPAISMVNVSSVRMSMSLFFPLTYSSSFSSPPPLHWQPTLFRSSYEQHYFSLSIFSMLSLTNTSQNILNWFCFCSNFFFLAVLFKPQTAFSSHAKKTQGGEKKGS